ncbi:hypothetical protein [Streptomyces sp. NBC_01264]|uniref:hypothetical protein n=1 Tax=Streptomyces sp. NBC_01264 TaxID=2903804 RepID=UPI00224EA921|nr:hypothetical protein [Streptomyces sp. NBC_01264]MCX4781812.1 DUF11 domain-containing protein [Streptomyces sp. NBC_01264]
MAWIGAVLFALLASTLALEYAKAETKGAAALPATPDFKNGSFENPAVSVERHPAMPTDWTAWVSGGEGPIMTHGIYSPSDEFQTVVVRSGGIMQKFNMVGKELRYSFDARSAYGGVPQDLTYLAGADWRQSKTVQVPWNKWEHFSGITADSGGGIMAFKSAPGQEIAIDNVKVEYLPEVEGAYPASAPSLSVDKSVTMTADVTQTGGGPGHAAFLEVQLPAGVKYAGSAKVGRVQGNDVNFADVTAKVAGKKLTIPIGSTPGGSGGEIRLGERYRAEYTVQVDQVSDLRDTGSEVLPSSLLVNGGSKWLSSAVIVTPRADVGFDGGGFTNEKGYQVGDRADVDLVVKNNGPNNAQNVVINVEKPTGFQDFKPIAPLPQGVTCSEGGDTYECKLGSLAEHGSSKLTFSGEVKNSGSLKVEANLTSSTINLKRKNISATYSTTSSNRIDLGVKAEIQKNDGVSLPVGSVVKPGDKLKLVVKADNAGPARTQNFRVDLPLPAGVKLDEGVDGYDKTTGMWAVGLMEPQKDATLTLPVTVLADESKVALRAEVDPESYKNLEEVELGNNVSQTSVDIERSATLNVGVSVVPPAGDPKDYTPGDEVTYKIAVSNDGPSKASMVKISHVLPTAMKMEEWTGPEGTSYTSKDGTWTVPGIDFKQTADLTVKGIVPTDQEKTLYRVCVTGADIPDPRGYGPCDDSNKTEGHVAVNELNVVQLAAADLTVTPDAGTGSRPLPGEKVSWTVKTANPGVSKAQGLEIEVPVPAGVGDSEATPGSNGGTYEDGLWKPADVPIGGQAVIKMTGTVLPDHDKLDYRATLKQSKTPLDESKGSKIGDSVEKSVDVQQVAGLDVSIAAVDGKDAVKVGEQAKVKVTVANKEGPSTARNTVVEVGMPTVNGLTHDGGADFNGEPGGEGFGTWKVGDLKAGEEKSLTLTFTPAEAEELRFDVLAARSDAANPQECQDICGSTSVKVTADKPDDPDDPGNPDDPGKPDDPGNPDDPGKPGDPTPPPGDGQNPPADDGGKGDDGGKSLVDQVLASTGSNALWWGGGALGAAGIGAALMIAARRRR